MFDQQLFRPISIIVLVAFGLCSLDLSAQQVAKSMVRWPDSGQTTNNTATFGEDSDYRINMPVYQVHSDGTVTDTVTTLMWQREDGGEMSVESAQTYVDTLSLAGYTNWRLPTLLEALSIVNLDRLNPAMDVSVFSAASAEYWWTSERQYNDANKVWVTNSGGGSGAHQKTETISAGGNKKFHVRAVRDANAVPVVDHFVDNGDGTISDKLTDLMWQKVLSTDTLSWEQALSTAENLTAAGHSDWRLPNVKELCSIVDRTRNAPAMYTNLFVNTLSTRYWSSTAQYKQSANAWFVDMRSFGLSSYDPKTLKHAVICVRGGDSRTDVLQSDQGVMGVYPNPASEYLVVPHETQLNDVQMQVVDMLGTLVYDGVAQSRVDCRDLNNGIYILILNSKTTSRRLTFAVLHW